MQQVWIARSLREDRYEDLAFDQGFVSVGWAEVGDLALRHTFDEIKALVRATYPFVEREAAESYAAQLFSFRASVAKNDVILQLRRSSPDVAIGLVVGPYQYRPGLIEHVRHVRPVRWLRVDLPRASVETELLNMPALNMFFQIVDDEIVGRLVTLAKGLETSEGKQVRPEPSLEVGRRIPEESRPFVNLQRNLNYARSLATAGQHLAQLQVGSFEVADVFRAAWVQGVAALDHWVRQEIRARLLRLVDQPGDKPDGFRSFPLTLGLVEQVRQGELPLIDAVDAQLTQVRGHLTYQHPDKIKEAFSLVSDVKGLWDKVAVILSERSGDGEKLSAADARERLRLVVVRRNKIAHEYDEDPANPPAKRPIDAATVTQTIDWIEEVAGAILLALK